MENISIKIRKSKYIRSIAVLTSGSIIAQAIILLASPIVTRIYTPEQLGIYTLMITVLSMFAPVICSKYDSAIVIAKDEEEVYSLIVLGAILTTIFTIIISIGYQFYLQYNPQIVNEVGVFAYFIIIMLLISGVTNILTSYNNRYKQYRVMSGVYVKRTFFQYFFQIILGVLNFHTVGLILSNFISSLFGLKQQSSYLVENVNKFKIVKKEKILEVLKKYKNQFIFSTPAIFINSSAYSIINFFISGLFGIDVFGYYSLSYRMLGLPLSLISGNVSKVFYQNAADEYNKNGSYGRSLLIFSMILGVCAIPMVILMILLGPWAFKVFFGEQWIEAGNYVVILAPMYGIRLIVSALTPALIIVNKQKDEFIYQLMFMLASICSYSICKFGNLDIRLFLMIITILYSFIYVMLFYKIYKFSKGEYKNE